MKIVILEDNCDRRKAMAAYLADRLYTFDAVFFESPQPMLEYLREHLSEAICIALDHDMELIEGADGALVDPGTGREIADFLATRAPQCPVIPHTTNTEAAEAMALVLRDAAWNVHRVVPWGDLEWVHAAWGCTVRRVILDTAQPLHHHSANAIGRESTPPASRQPGAPAE